MGEPPAFCSAIRRRGSIVYLLPENTDFEPIRVDLREQSLVIEGLGVGILRNHNL